MSERDREGELIQPVQHSTTDPVQYPQGDPPFKDELTIIWHREKIALHQRQDNQEQVIEQLNRRIMVLEAWALQLKRDPTVFTERPLSEHPLYRPEPGKEPGKSIETDPEVAQKRIAEMQSLGAGIGQAVPKARSTPPVATKYIPSPFEKDYEGPTEGHK